MKKITGNCTIAEADYHTYSFVGSTKTGKPIIITVKDAINLENVNLTFQDKDEVVPQITVTATYQEDNRSGAEGEPWDISYEADPSNIVLGEGVVKIDNDKELICRGGGKFTIEREYKQISADGDKGPVKGRIRVTQSVAKLQMNVLTFLDSTTKLYPGLTETESS